MSEREVGATRPPTGGQSSSRRSSFTEESARHGATSAKGGILLSSRQTGEGPAQEFDPSITTPFHPQQTRGGGPHSSGGWSTIAAGGGGSVGVARFESALDEAAATGEGYVGVTDKSSGPPPHQPSSAGEASSRRQSVDGHSIDSLNASANSVQPAPQPTAQRRPSVDLADKATVYASLQTLNRDIQALKGELANSKQVAAKEKAASDQRFIQLEIQLHNGIRGLSDEFTAFASRMEAMIGNLVRSAPATTPPAQAAAAFSPPASPMTPGRLSVSSAAHEADAKPILPLPDFTQVYPTSSIRVAHRPSQGDDRSDPNTTVWPQFHFVGGQGLKPSAILGFLTRCDGHLRVNDNKLPCDLRAVWDRETSNDTYISPLELLDRALSLEPETKLIKRDNVCSEVYQKARLYIYLRGEDLVANLKTVKSYSDRIPADEAQYNMVVVAERIEAVYCDIVNAWHRSNRESRRGLSARKEVAVGYLSRLPPYIQEQVRLKAQINGDSIPPRWSLEDLHALAREEVSPETEAGSTLRKKIFASSQTSDLINQFFRKGNASTAKKPSAEGSDDNNKQRKQDAKQDSKHANGNKATGAGGDSSSPPTAGDKAARICGNCAQTGHPRPQCPAAYCRSWSTTGECKHGDKCAHKQHHTPALKGKSPASVTIPPLPARQ